MIWLVSLYESISLLNMATADTSEDLSKQMKGAFLGGIIGQGKTRVGLDDTDSSEVW